MRTALRYLLLACGLIALALGVIGLFLPVLPTTPFILLAAACFLRSSKRLHALVVGHPVLGPPVQDFFAGRGISRRTKTVAITTLWASILGSAWFCVPSPWLDGLLVAIAAGVTVYLLKLPTRPAEPAEPAEPTEPDATER